MRWRCASVRRPPVEVHDATHETTHLQAHHTDLETRLAALNDRVQCSHADVGA